MEDLILLLIEKIESLTKEVSDIKDILKENTVKNTSPTPQNNTSTQPSVKKILLRDLTDDKVRNMEEKAALWLFNKLKPYHQNKKVFMNARLDTWVRDIKLILHTHKRNKTEFINLVEWMIRSNKIAAVQSAGFFTKRAGKNYDIFLGFMEEESKKKNDKTNEIPIFQSKIKRHE